MMFPTHPHIIAKESHHFDCKMSDIWTIQIPQGEDGKVDQSIIYDLIHNSHSYPVVSFECNDGIVVIFYKVNQT